MIGSAIQATASSMNTLVNNIANGIIASKERKQELELFERQQDFAYNEARNAEKFEKEENELAFEREKEMWNMQNEYNSPLEQMKRFESAGLNPNLIYGQGTSGNATSAPSYNATSSKQSQTLNVPKLTSRANVNLQSDFSSLMEYQRLTAQTDLTEAQIRHLDSQTHSNDIANHYKDANEQLDYALKMLKFKRDTGLITEDELRRESMRLENKYKSETLDVRIDRANLENTLKSLDAGIKRNILSLYELNKRNIKSQTLLNEANIKLLREKLTIEQKRNLVESLNLDSEKELYETLKTNPKYVSMVFNTLKEIGLNK